MAAVALAPAIDHTSSHPPGQRVREIQGLRALAVTSVVAYHLSPRALPGGFVGVDVFFVISGYLITSLLLREVELSGRVDLRRFWERRVRRLIPAQMTVAVLSAIAAVAVFPRHAGADALRQVPTAVLNVHNIALARASVDYLAQDSAGGMLDHYWSLAIEEQFYLGLPLVLAALALRCPSWRSFVRRATAAIIVILVLSASYLTLSLPAWSPSDYFSTGMRVWQLAAGALLALVIRRLPRDMLLLRTAGVAGVGAILVATLVIDGAGAYPSVSATLPVGGAVLALWGFAHPRGGVRSSLLRSRPLVAVGDWSYSIYLVHWPVIVIGRQVAGGRESPSVLALELLVIAGLSLVLHRHVETPLRHGPETSVRRSVLWRALAVIVGVAGTAVLAATLLAGAHGERLDTVPTGLGSPYGAPALGQPGGPHFLTSDIAVHPDPAAAARLDTPLAGIEECQIEPEDRVPRLCELGASAPAPTVLLLGDSHAAQWLPAVRAIADQRGWRVLTILHSSCAFSTVPRAYSPAAESACRSANEATAKLVAERDDVDLVLTSALSGDSFAGSTEDPDVGARGFAGAWRELVAHGMPVVAIRDNPRFVAGGRVTDCVRHDDSSPQRCDLDRAASMFEDQQIAAVESTPGTALIDLTDHLCLTDTCPAVIGSVLVYRDNNHLTATFARSLARALDHELGGVCARTLECGELF